MSFVRFPDEFRGSLGFGAGWRFHNMLIGNDKGRLGARKRIGMKIDVCQSVNWERPASHRNGLTFKALRRLLRELRLKAAGAKGQPSGAVSGWH